MRMLMIHEMNKEILSFMITEVKETDVLTFDDGLYSCFYYWPAIRDIFKKNKKIFFISTGLVRSSDIIGEKDLTCEEALTIFSESGSTKGYMNWDEIKTIKQEGGIIGGHGHLHYGEYGAQVIQGLQQEITKMKENFKQNLGSDFILQYYACPYNRYFRIEKAFLGKDVEIVGRERYDIRELMGKPGYKINGYREFNIHN